MNYGAFSYNTGHMGIPILGRPPNITRHRRWHIATRMRGLLVSDLTMTYPLATVVSVNVPQLILSDPSIRRSS